MSKAVGRTRSRSMRVLAGAIVFLGSIFGLITNVDPVHAALGVQLISSSSFVDSISYVHVVGEVVNNGTVNAEFIQINVSLYDSGGTLLSTDVTFTDAGILAPGEKSPFADLTPEPAGYDHYAITSISPSSSPSPPNHNFVTTVTNVYIDGVGYQHIVGTVTNGNTNTDQFVEVIGTFYNGAGTTVNDGLTFINTDSTSSLAAGQTAPFDLIYSPTDPSYASRALLTESSTAPSPAAATTTAVRSSSDPSTVGASVTYTATVAPTPDGGTVAFTDNASTMTGCSAVAVNTSTGKASCTTSYSVVGSHAILASYSGDTNYAASSGSLTQQVNAATTTTTVASSSNPSTVGSSVTYTATVAPTPDGGTVSFTDNAATLTGCSAVAVNTSTGKASCTTSYSAVGSHVIVASYAGDTNYAASSGSLTQQVNRSGASQAPPRSPAPRSPAGQSAPSSPGPRHPATRPH